MFARVGARDMPEFMRDPGRCTVAYQAIITGNKVTWGFTRSLRAIMTTRASTGYQVVIEGGRDPGRCTMAVIALCRCLNMCQRLARGGCAVMTGCAR